MLQPTIQQWGTTRHHCPALEQLLKQRGLPFYFVGWVPSTARAPLRAKYVFLFCSTDTRLLAGGDSLEQIAEELARRDDPAGK